MKVVAFPAPEKRRKPAGLASKCCDVQALEEIKTKATRFWHMGGVKVIRYCRTCGWLESNIEFSHQVLKKMHATDEKEGPDIAEEIQSNF